ncbi:MAG: DUF1194 domain-containing protein [Alphaproteobacteria bacterium]
MLHRTNTTRMRLLALAVMLMAVAGLRGPVERAFGQTGRVEVDLALVLAVDCSYSVDATEFRLQMQGLAQAIASPQVIAAIGQGPVGRIAVTLFQWSDSKNQITILPWTVISGAASATKFATAVSAAPRMTAEGATSISSALIYAAKLLDSAPVQPLRRVIDVSADGGNNNGMKPEIARNQIVARGITINGLAIINEVPYLDKYFENHITGGPGTFVTVANEYAVYFEAIRRKLILEITGPVLS